MKVYQKDFDGINNPIHTKEAFKKTSKRYGFQSSEKIASYFENNGFELEGVSYGNARGEKQGYQKHIMVFSRPDLIIDGENKLRILALNSHDGSTALKLNLGVYRAICANGLVAGDSFYSQNIRHIGDMKKKVEESLKYVASHLMELKNQVKNMQQVVPDFEQSHDFIVSSAMARLENVKNIHSIELNTVDKARRYADKTNNLWTLFNRVQENCIRGGIKYIKEVEILDAKGKPIGTTLKQGTTRGLTSVDKSLKLNKTIWENSLKMIA